MCEEDSFFDPSTGIVRARSLFVLATRSLTDMSTPTRPPRVYRPGLVTRLLDGFRYGGGLSQWSWLIHRLTGLGILFFLIVHILDTFLVVVMPAWYDHTVAMYGGVWFDGHYYGPLRWAFRFAELGLIASVVFHAVNGVGIILYDFWSKGTSQRKGILKGVQIVFLAIMIPTTLFVLYPLSQPPKHHVDAVTKAAAPSLVPAAEPLKMPAIVQAPRSALLMFGTMGVAVVWLAVIGFVPPAGTRVKPSAGFELRAWYWMRISGLLLVLLAVGHLFIMHILNNVETINYQFGADRWDAPQLGALWRMWDFAMIALAVGHGFNGLRQVLFEYVAQPGRRVLLSTVIWLTSISLIGVGSYAIFMFKTDRGYILKTSGQGDKGIARAGGSARLPSPAQ
jgi:succinate dehydrogenase hydrophobic anchor subunit